MRSVVIISFLAVSILSFQCNWKTKNKQKEKDTSLEMEQQKEDKKAEKVQNRDPNIPVATFETNMEDELTNNDFKVEIYPTSDVNKFKVAIFYGQNSARDTILFPDPQYYKKPALRKSKTKNTCLIGFIGKDGDFREMKKVIASGTQIRIKGLKAYYFE